MPPCLGRGLARAEQETMRLPTETSLCSTQYVDPSEDDQSPAKTLYRPVDEAQKLTVVHRSQGSSDE